MSSKVPNFYFEDCPPAKPAKVANLYSTETAQTSAPGARFDLRRLRLP